MGICRGNIRAWALVMFGLVALSAFGEHEYPTEPAPSEEPSLRKTSTDTLIQPSVFAKAGAPTSGLNSLAILQIQETVSRTDPQMLQALKQALADISEGRVVNGQAGAIALELLSKIPDSDVGAPAAAPAAAVAEQPQANAPGKLAESASPSPDRFKEFGAEGPKKDAPAGAPARVSAPSTITVPAGTVLRVESPSVTPSVVGNRTVASIGNPAFGEIFPYGTSSEANLKEEGANAKVRVAEKGKGKRPAKGVSEAGSAGEALPTGEGGQASGGSPGSATGGGNLGTIVLGSGLSRPSLDSPPLAGADGRQRLAGVVSSFLGRFQSRAVASLHSDGSRPGIFGKLASRGGVTTERALAKAASSPVYREFQRATTEAGFSPTESLGAYYSVLAMAWLCTFGFVAYLMRNLPALRIAWAEKRKKKD